MDNRSLFFTIFNLNGHFWLLDQLMVFGAAYLIYLVFILVILLAIKGGIREKKAFLLLILAVPVTVFLIKIIHLFYFEPRPFVQFHFSPVVPETTGAAFPSRHAAISAAIAFAFIVFKSKWSILFLILAVWIGFSRIFAGVHYPLDIIGGFFTASVALFISLQIGKIFKKYFLAA